MYHIGMTEHSPGRRLRDAVEAERPLQVAGTINAYSALLAGKSGFRAIYLSGAGVANASFGLPDLGITGLNDVCEDVRRMCGATALPLLVDADTGFGAAFSIARTTRELARAGAAGLHLEDQVQAKRCGHRPGKELVAATEMVDRIRAAVDARDDDAFVVMARTDAHAVEGQAAAIERAAAYVEAGADMIFAEALTTLDEYREFTRALEVPVLANITEFGRTPLFTTAGARRGRRAARPLSAVRLPRDEPRRARRVRRNPPRRHAESRRRPHADARRALRRARLSRLRAQARRTVQPRQGAQGMSNGGANPAGFKPKKSVALSGVVAGNTAICTVGRSGNDLHYRGYDILDIAESCEFEEIAYLLIHGKLPNPAELAAYKRRMKGLRGLCPRLRAELEQLPATRAPDGRAADGRVRARLRGARGPVAHRRRCTRRSPTGWSRRPGPMLCYWYHFARTGKRIDVETDDDSAGGHFLHMLHGKPPQASWVRAMHTSLILYAEHEFNASTFTARVIAGTGSDMLLLHHGRDRRPARPEARRRQ